MHAKEQLEPLLEKFVDDGIVNSNTLFMHGDIASCKRICEGSMLYGRPPIIASAIGSEIGKKQKRTPVLTFAEHSNKLNSLLFCCLVDDCLKNYSIEFLLKRGFDPNFANEFGMTALHIAAINGAGSTIELLLDYKADPTIRNAQGLTAVETAIKAKKPNAVTVICSYKDAKLKRQETKQFREHIVSTIDNTTAQLKKGRLERQQLKAQIGDIKKQIELTTALVSQLSELVAATQTK